MDGNESFDRLGRTLKLAAAALRENGIPFVLGGSLATWARGGPRPANDLDLMVKPADAEQALEVLARAGMRPERPPEEWLYKAWDGDVLIDLIFMPAGLEMTDAVIERADEVSVLAVTMPVMKLEDVLTTKLMALDEHSLDYGALLGMARALREQIDWPGLRARTGASPYAQAFFALVEGLGVAPSAGEVAVEGEAGATRVRVVSGHEAA